MRNDVPRLLGADLRDVAAGARAMTPELQQGLKRLAAELEANQWVCLFCASPYQAGHKTRCKLNHGD